MKAKLNIDLTIEQKDSIKSIAKLRGQTIKGYIMTLLDEDYQNNKHKYTPGNPDSLRCPYRYRTPD